MVFVAPRRVSPATPLAAKAKHMVRGIESEPVHTISFCRGHAILLRQIASNKEPAVSQDLRRIAQDWESVADTLEEAAGNRRTLTP
jgi:hypothetical protein